MWFTYALSFALITAISLAISKKILTSINEYLFLWLSSIFILPFLFIIILVLGIPKFDLAFLEFIVIASLINFFAILLAYKALKNADLSLVSPVAAFNPVFTAFIANFSLGETINLRGWLGILLICVGTYIIQLSEVSKGWLKPFTSLLTTQALRFSLIAYFLWAITPIFQKMAIEHTYPSEASFAAFVGVLMSVILLSFTYSKFGQQPFPVVKRYFRLWFLLGLMGGLGSAVAFSAISQANLGFVTAVFKLSILFSVLLGLRIFGEKKFKERFIGSVLMVVGISTLIT